MEDDCLVANGHEAAVGQSMGTCIACSEAGKYLEGIARPPKHLPPKLCLNFLSCFYCVYRDLYLSREEAKSHMSFQNTGWLFQRQ